MTDGARFRFHPLERRGLLFGLDGPQLGTLIGGLLAAVVLRDAIGGNLGLLTGAAAAAAGLAGAVWTNDGRSLGSWVLVAGTWALRRRQGAWVDPRPLEGSTCGAPPKFVSSSGRGRRGRTGSDGAPDGISLRADNGLPGEDRIGVVRDRRSGTWSAVVPVGGCSFSLLDQPQQAQMLESWRRVLGSAARAGSPVLRLQWVQRSWSGGPSPATSVNDSPPGCYPDAVCSYRQMLDSRLPATIEHAAWVVLVVRAGGSPRRGSSGAKGAGPVGLPALRREMRLLDGQLTAAGLRPGRPLGPERLTSLLAAASDGSRPSAGGRAAPWPLASDDRWSSYRADGLWHATYWIAEWPRVDVGPDFLSPLLLIAARVTVSVTMAPVAAERAMREVRAARTADVADSELRARAGFLSNARRDRESEGVALRESELVDGHQEFRFSGYVTVSAGSPDQLAIVSAEVEQAAHSARVELKRLFGRQAEAFTWTLPLGRGLR